MRLWLTILSIMELVKSKRNNPNQIPYSVQWARSDAGTSLFVYLFSCWNFPWPGIKWALFLWHRISITRAQIQTSPTDVQPIAHRTNSIAIHLRKPFKWHGIWCAHDNSWRMHRKWFSCLAFWWGIWFLVNWPTSKYQMQIKNYKQRVETLTVFNSNWIFLSLLPQIWSSWSIGFRCYGSIIVRHCDSICSILLAILCATLFVGRCYWWHNGHKFRACYGIGRNQMAWCDVCPLSDSIQFGPFNIAIVRVLFPWLASSAACTVDSIAITHLILLDCSSEYLTLFDFDKPCCFIPFNCIPSINFHFQESPRWLFTIGRVDDTVVILEKAAAFNKRPTESIKMDIEKHAATTKSAKDVARGNFLDLIRTPVMRSNTLYMCFNWLVCGMCFFGVAQYIGQSDGNIFQNVAISAGLEWVFLPISRIQFQQTFL